MTTVMMCGAGMCLGGQLYAGCGLPVADTGEIFKASCRHEHVILLPLCAHHASQPDDHRCLACNDHPTNPHSCPLLLSPATARDVKEIQFPGGHVRRATPGARVAPLAAELGGDTGAKLGEFDA